MSFGDIIRSVSAPGARSSGIGGDSNTIWHSQSRPSLYKIYELSTFDLSIIRSANSQGDGAEGVGGTSSIIWHCDENNDKVYELSTTDFSIVRSANSPATFPTGMGGDATVIWHCDSHADRIYELDTTDFSVVRSGNGLSTQPSGIGGTSSIIWHCDIDAPGNKIFQLSTIDFSSIKTASVNVYPDGIGGDATVIWHCDNFTDKIYELDSGVSLDIQVGDTVLLIPNYGDTYDRAAIKGGVISTSDNVQLYPLKGGAKVAIKESWSSGDKIIF